MDQSVLRRIDTQPQAASARPNLYTFVHKGLRTFMGDTLAALGRADPGDDAEMARALDQVDELLAISLSHLEHEDRFMHGAMEACAPGSSDRTADDHVEHLASLAALRDALARARGSAAPDRPRACAALYGRLARFVAENFEHMETEETHNMAVLWDAMDDAQLGELHQALVAAIPPQEMAVFLRWILPSLSHPERAGMLAQMRAEAPAEAFDGALAICRAHLARHDYVRLAGALGLADADGIVERW